MIIIYFFYSHKNKHQIVELNVKNNQWGILVLEILAYYFNMIINFIILNSLQLRVLNLKLKKLLIEIIGLAEIIIPQPMTDI